MSRNKHTGVRMAQGVVDLTDDDGQTGADGAAPSEKKTKRSGTTIRSTEDIVIDIDEEISGKPEKTKTAKSKRKAADSDFVDSSDIPETKPKKPRKKQVVGQDTTLVDAPSSHLVDDVEIPEKKPRKVAKPKQSTIDPVDSAVVLNPVDSAVAPEKKLKKGSKSKQSAAKGETAIDAMEGDEIESEPKAAAPKGKGRKKAAAAVEDEDIDFDLDDYMPGSSGKPVAVDKDQMVSYLEQELGIEGRRVKGAVTLFQEGCTLPFIARYRKEQTGEMSEDELRKVEVLMERFTNLVSRKAAVLAVIDKSGKLTAQLRAKIDAARTLAEVYSPMNFAAS
jgi:hypothetical protein